MTNLTLAQSYLVKAQKRLMVLDVLFREQAYSDVIGEAQELVELALKAMLRHIGVDPPKQHDVGELLLDFRDRFPAEVGVQAQRLADISKWLRKERELAFCGDVDFIPTSEYGPDDGKRAIEDAQFVVHVAAQVVRFNPEPGQTGR
ncbi:MAG: HEPN domain-containing protein [Bacillota bacterium]